MIFVMLLSLPVTLGSSPANGRGSIGDQLAEMVLKRVTGRDHSRETRAVDRRVIRCQCRINGFVVGFYATREVSGRRANRHPVEVVEVRVEQFIGAVSDDELDCGAIADSF
jgi:hypothetical protein